MLIFPIFQVANDIWKKFNYWSGNSLGFERNLRLGGREVKDGVQNLMMPHSVAERHLSVRRPDSWVPLAARWRLHLLAWDRLIVVDEIY